MNRDLLQSCQRKRNRRSCHVHAPCTNGVPCKFCSCLCLSRCVCLVVDLQIYRLLVLNFAFQLHQTSSSIPNTLYHPDSIQNKNTPTNPNPIQYAIGPRLHRFWQVRDRVGRRVRGWLKKRHSGVRSSRPFTRRKRRMAGIFLEKCSTKRPCRCRSNPKTRCHMRHQPRSRVPGLHSGQERSRVGE